MIHSWPVHNREEWLARRKANVNASEAAALFGSGVHPFLTPYKLWALKSGKIDDDGDDKMKRRGRLFEPVVVDCLREDFPDWRINRTAVYFWDDEHRVGCTPDVDAVRPDIYGAGIIQIKTVGQFAFKRRWHDENGNIAVPTWVAVQASLEAYLTGATWAGVAAMKLGDGGIEIIYVDVPLKYHLITRIEDLASEFWRRVRDNEPYDPDFGRDQKIIWDLYQEGDGPLIDLSGDAEFGTILQDRAQLKQIKAAGDAADKQRKTLDARIIARLGNSPAARYGARVVTVKLIKKKGYAVGPQQYPQVWVKGAKGVDE